MGGALLLPPLLRGGVFPASSNPDVQSPNPEFHLHPHYRAKMPLDATLLKLPPGSDDFVHEKYADQITRIFEEWKTRLIENSADIAAIETSLGDGFLGSSFMPTSSEALRSGPIESSRMTFAANSSLRREAFLRELRAAMSSFASILVAEFQVTGINVSPDSKSDLPGHSQIKTRMRYELVGTVKNFYREQRVGYWELEWGTTLSKSTEELRLLNWKMLGETRSRSLEPIFEDITQEVFAGCSSYSAQLLHGSDYWRTVLDGACGIDVYGHNGVSVGDIDNDGFDELYVCQPAGLPNRLYRTRGDGTFEDITESAGVGVLENTPCALFADIDNDGRQDLIVVRTNGPLLFINEGGGKFRQKPGAFKFANAPQGTFAGAAIADYDRDSWLDIYFCLYIYYQGTGQYKYPTPYYAAENGPPNFLMRNNRDHTFQDVTAASGLDTNNTRYSFCCGWSDYNHDGWPDLYVVNDFGKKNLYLNHGDGTFSDVAAQMGVEDVGAGMSVSWLDYNNDGSEDLYVADMWTAAGERISHEEAFQKEAPPDIRALYRKHAMGNSLFLNRGNGFEDRTRAAAVDIGRWAWSSDAWDFDHDGFLDLYVVNGMVSAQGDDLNSFFWRQVVGNSPAQAKASYDYEQGWNAINELVRSDSTWSGYERNVFYANNGNGTFSDVSGIVGMDFVEDGRSFALSDFDHDGRLELVLKNRNAPQLRLLRNVMTDLLPSIAFRLQGTKSNRDAIGATITIESSSGRQTRTLQAGSGFLSQHSKELFFGLGNTKGPIRAAIRWPSGLTQELDGLPLNHRISIEEGSPTWREEPFKPGRSQAQERPNSSAAQIKALHPVRVHGQEPLPSSIETWLLVPMEAPDFSLPSLSGRSLSLARLRSKAVLLNFWTADSAACQQDLKTFRETHKRWASAGLELLAVNVDDSKDQQSLQAWAAKQGFSFPVLRSTDEIAGVYNILFRYLFDRHRDLDLPTSFLINAQGEIAKVYRGSVNPAQVELDFRHMPETDAERLTRALPFAGLAEVMEFRRNYLSYGSIFFQREYYDQARASFEHALRDNPSSAEASYGLGSVYLAQQKNQEARECFERVTKLQVSYPDTLPNTWNNLGLIATREGRTADAIASFEEALRLSPDYLIALTNLGNVYRQQRQWNQAREILERAVSIGPSDPDANYSLGMVYAQLNDTTHAYQYLERALEFRPVYPEALNNLGVLYVRTQRLDEAIQTFEQCIRVAPGFDQSYLNLARVYVIEGAPDKARSVLVELLKQRPNQAEGQKMLDQLGR